jgi:hypothetical protein
VQPGSRVQGPNPSSQPERNASGPPLWAAVGTVVGAALFIGFTQIYLPWRISGWRFRPPFLGWAPTRWMGVVLIVLALPVILDFLIRFAVEGHGTPRSGSSRTACSATCAIRRTWPRSPR